ncbi:thioredoxin-like protein [Gorgonomyces haynaldii]|nr:thioredoxin-like protein [Gorgonomyces haynaldii]
MLRQFVRRFSQVPKGTTLEVGEKLPEYLKHQQGLVLVDFHADWCGPCRFLGPMLEETVKQADAVLLKVNVDESPKVSEHYQIASLPTVMAFKNETQLGGFIGSRDKKFLQTFVQDLASK